MRHGSTHLKVQNGGRPWHTLLWQLLVMYCARCPPPPQITRGLEHNSMSEMTYATVLWRG